VLEKSVLKREFTPGDSAAVERRKWPQPPGDDAPVVAHVTWMVRSAAMFDEIALVGGGYGLSQKSAVRAADYLRRLATELAARPSTGLAAE
jgi:hypothetical protein